MQSDQPFTVPTGGGSAPGNQWTIDFGDTGGGGQESGGDTRVDGDRNQTSLGDHDALDLYHQNQRHDDLATTQLSPVNDNVRPDYYTHAAPNQRSQSRSPVRSQLRSASGPAASRHGLNTYRSNPALMPSRNPGTVKDIASRFNMVDDAQPLPVRTSQARYRRHSTAKNSTVRSPLKEGAKLQKRRPGEPTSPTKSPTTSFETAGSFSSDMTVTTSRSRSQSTMQSSKPGSPTSPRGMSKPLFGEITSDGQWNGNFDLGNYGPLPTFPSSYRRGSDGTVALGHGRTQSHQEMSNPHSPNYEYGFGHKRTRSDMDTQKPQPSPSMPQLNISNIPTLYPTPSSSTTTSGMHSAASAASSRIPISTSRRQSSESSMPDSRPHSRPASSMSNRPGRRRLSKSPTRKQQGASDKENAISSPKTHKRRYEPISTSTSSQKLSAKIVAPAAKISPPLRSSRPRQPVSSATTSASRARAAEAAQQTRGISVTDRRRPSEQWLGKPYDPMKEQAKRKIPQLGKDDFEERRQRIQKAINQNLEESKSKESLQGPTSRKSSADVAGDAFVGSAVQDQNRGASLGSTHLQPLSIETEGIQEPNRAIDEPLTATTEFEDESPVLGRTSVERNILPQTEESPDTPTESTPTLLTSATYKPPSIPTNASIPPRISTVEEAPEEEAAKSPSLLENVMRMRQRSPSSTSRDGTEFTDESPATFGGGTGFGMEDRWGLGTGFDRSGSIKIMLDQDPPFRTQAEDWQHETQQRVEEVQQRTAEQVYRQSQEWNHQAITSNALSESPVDEQGSSNVNNLEGASSGGPTKQETLKPTTFGQQNSFNLDGISAKNRSYSQALETYHRTGEVSPEMLRELETHMVDLNGASMNGGSDAMLVQNLLDSIVDSRTQVRNERLKPNALKTPGYVPSVGPDTPSDFNPDEGGAAFVYSPRQSENYNAYENQEDEDFEARIARADEEWERQQQDESNAVAGAYEEVRPPPPPPKDDGYTPRSSIGPQSGTLPASLFESGLRISTTGPTESRHIRAPSETAKSHYSESQGPQSPLPPPPTHAPPAPPSPLPLPHNLTEIPQIPVPMSEQPPIELSPQLRKAQWGPGTGSSRPSVESQRAPRAPGSISVASLSEATQTVSLDQDSSNTTGVAKVDTSNPEHKRLHKRRHIIKELLDTENTYHQDLKIIEDIYKATAGDLVTAEDKKTLFGNCDEIEKFSLQFYDELRKSVTAVYVPPKSNRFVNRRGSFSTTQSDNTTQTTLINDPVDDEKDRCTVVGHTFIRNLPRMEQLYGAYLKNHDAANQRLAAVQSVPSVKCWLDECHKNASDITSAWDLDSLLVKPTQRVAKYPMLLQQLFDCTPPDHPDHESLKIAATNSISMLTRINEAKKRADLVDQIVNRKAKDTKTSGGFTFKLKGRTEKLKERVGVAEAFQDTDFDELAHRFGGHFIRLQICMRDVQDYLNRTERAINQINNNAQALEQVADTTPSSLPEYEAKWRKYSQAIRELTAVALEDHKNAVSKRVIQPMVACIKLHEGPQNAINKRKKRVVDYARCRSLEKRGEKPDKRTQDAADLYIALNDQLKIDLPKLYALTGKLVQNCLKCFLDIQLKWFKTWELKLTPILDVVPSSIQQILPPFRADHELVVPQLMELSICNGSLLADAANFLSPSVTLTAEDQGSSKRPSILNAKRAMSSGSDAGPTSLSTPDSSKRHSGSYVSGTLGVEPLTSSNGRGRSNSSLSSRQMSGSTLVGANISSTGRPYSNQNSSLTTSPMFGSNSRPSTATNPSSSQYTSSTSYIPQPSRISADNTRSPRPSSSNTYFTARIGNSADSAPSSSNNTPNLNSTNQDSHRFSGIFSSAMPPSDSSFSSPNLQQQQQKQVSSPQPALKPADVPAQFVCASLFEFNIDGTRREAGYPYLTYTQGEVFDVIAQKGELWLARNQDDASATLGWIWEQHFVVLSAD